MGIYLKYARLLQERCILDGTLTVNYEQVDTEYRLRHNDLLANIVHRLGGLSSSRTDIVKVLCV